MKKWRVSGTVVGSAYLGEFEAETKEEAEEMALNSDAASISFCWQCSDQCEDPEVQSVHADEVTD